jgi:hypothetical protein
MLPGSLESAPEPPGAKKAVCRKKIYAWSSFEKSFAFLFAADTVVSLQLAPLSPLKKLPMPGSDHTPE